jgi:hypothetical protein
MLNIPDFTPIQPERQGSPAPPHSGSIVEQPAMPVHSKHAMAPRKLVRLLEESTSPIYLLDSKNRVRFVNKKLSELLTPFLRDLQTGETITTSVTGEELLGIECGQRIPSDLQPKREISSLLSIPVISTGEYSPFSVACLPLPVDAQRGLNQWSAVLVVPLNSEAVAELLVGKKDAEISGSKGSFDKSGFRLCIWIEGESQLGAIVCRTPDWNDRKLIQSVLLEQRKRYSKLDDFVSLIGTSNSARLAMNQLQVAIAVDANCVLQGPAGSEQQRIAKSILEHRRRRQGRSINSVYTLPIECRLMDRLLMSEMMELATTHLDSSSRKMDRNDIDETQVNLILEGVDSLPLDAIEPLLLFLNQHPKVCVIATADNRQPSTLENQDHVLPASSTQLIPPHKNSHSNRDIRSELMSTIGVLKVEIPALQDRIEDIPVLAEQILEQIRQASSSKESRSISPALRRWLQTYSWPGNYSELHRAISSAVATSKARQLEPHDLPLVIRTFASHDLKQDPPKTLDLDQSLENYERIILKRALSAYQNNRAAAARSLGISRSRFLRRLEQLSIDTSSSEESQFPPEIDKSSLNKHDQDTTKRTAAATRESADSHPSVQTSTQQRVEIPQDTNSSSLRTSSPSTSGRNESHDDPDLPIFESID